MKQLATLSLLAAALVLTRSARAADDKGNINAKAPLTAAESADADKAWKAVLEAAKPPLPPQEWQGKTPTDEQREAFNKQLGEQAAVAADKAREFYKKYPNHPKAEEAQKKEKKLLEQAIALGQKDRIAQLSDNPALSEDDKFSLRANEISRAAMKKQPEGLAAVLAEYEKGVRALIKDFPNRSEPYGLLLTLAHNTPPDKAKGLLKEVLDSKADQDTKDAATAMLKQFDAVGQPVDIVFKAIDGREVDLKKLKGKVVLLDFWATWCGPCVGEVPNVKRVYSELHPKGFEILGISLDKNEKALRQFVEENEITWPQYFDGKGWGNTFGMQFNVTAIPAMYLVDKKGLLRETDAREGLEDKVKKLLAE